MARQARATGLGTKANARLRAARARLRTVLHAVPDTPARSTSRRITPARVAHTTPRTMMDADVRMGLPTTRLARHLIRNRHQNRNRRRAAWTFTEPIFQSGPLPAIATLAGVILIREEGLIAARRVVGRPRMRVAVSLCTVSKVPNRPRKRTD
jgi:hypothetical protein